MKVKLLFLFLICINYSFAQEIETKYISKTKLKADTFIGVDEFEHIYYIKNNVLYKIREKDTLNYSNPQYGTLNQVTIQNPFKIILFYKEFNVAVFLDNNLNELSGKIDFTLETLFNNVALIGISSENNLWLYADDTKLHLYDFQNRIEMIQTQPITFYKKKFDPIELVSNYKNIWLLSTKGILQFNEYGNFINYFEVENASKIFIVKKGIVYVKDGKIYKLEKYQHIPVKTNHNYTKAKVYINNNSVYYYDGKFIYAYKFL